jgi:peptidyl-tRNA hydrolase, PTH2 family
MALEYKVKQVIVIRRDLKMRRGKEYAQAGHASQGWLTSQFVAGRGELAVVLGEDLESWLGSGTAKIVVGCTDETELLALVAKAKEAGVYTYVVTDAGNTEFHGVPTITCAAFGPARVEALARLTGHLKLL